MYTIRGNIAELSKSLLINYAILPSDLEFLLFLLPTENFNIFDRSYNGAYPTFDFYLGQSGTAAINHDDKDYSQKFTYSISYNNGSPYINLNTPILGRVVRSDNDSAKSILFLSGKKADSDGKYLNTYFMGYTTLFSPKPLILILDRKSVL